MCDFDALRVLMCGSRSTRRFKHAEKIEQSILLSLVDQVRWVPSGRNQQPLRYAIVDDEPEFSKIHAPIQWATNLTEWEGPGEEERPAAYIVICYDRNVSDFPWVDAGIAVRELMLLAYSLGLASCPLASIDKTVCRQVLELDESIEPILALALGKSAETVVAEEADGSGELHYYRDAQDAHHVPKRFLDEVLLKNRT